MNSKNFILRVSHLVLLLLKGYSDVREWECFSIETKTFIRFFVVDVLQCEIKVFVDCYCMCACSISHPYFLARLFCGFYAIFCHSATQYPFKTIQKGNVRKCTPHEAINLTKTLKESGAWIASKTHERVRKTYLLWICQFGFYDLFILWTLSKLRRIKRTRCRGGNRCLCTWCWSWSAAPSAETWI